MTIHHSILCAFPKMECPPSKNDWLPSTEQVLQILSPLNENERPTLSLIDSILDGNANRNHWQTFENSQLERGTPHPVSFIRSIFNAIECARYINLTIALPMQQHSTESPNLANVIQANGVQPYMGMQYVFPWLVPYRKNVESNKFREADNLFCANLWQTCERQIQENTDLGAILARYTQWKLCSQRQLVDSQNAKEAVKSNLNANIQLSA